MIDTDKYEGHTEGPWTLSEEYAYELFIYAGDVRLAEMDGNAPLHVNEHGNPEDVNAQLIADAPLILAAYDKQVRWINDILFRLEKMQEASEEYRSRYLQTVYEELEMMIE